LPRRRKRQCARKTRRSTQHHQGDHRRSPYPARSPQAGESPVKSQQTSGKGKLLRHRKGKIVDVDKPQLATRMSHMDTAIIAAARLRTTIKDTQATEREEGRSDGATWAREYATNCFAVRH
jgi:DNA replication initiation complex subunit (GINS family)